MANQRLAEIHQSEMESKARRGRQETEKMTLDERGEVEDGKDKRGGGRSGALGEVCVCVCKKCRLG